MDHHPIPEPLDRLAAPLHRDPFDEPGDPSREVGSGRVPALLGELAVAGDVEEADRGWPFDARMEAGAFQCRLEALEDVAHPGSGLLAVVDREEGLVGDRAGRPRELLGPHADLARWDAGAEERHQDLAPPP